MNKVINLGIPHVGEHIFESIETDELFQFMSVSETWKVLAENVLIKRLKGWIFEACQNGETKVVRLLLEHSDQSIDFNARDEEGMTAFLLAAENGHNDIVKLLESKLSICVIL